MIIMFSGGIASGKTTLSRSLAGALKCQWASFGNLVRREAERRGLACTREVLQDLGEDLVKDNPRAFCEMFLEAEGWVQGELLIVDGLRHLEVLAEFRLIVGEVRLVFTYAEFAVRRDRVLKGEGGDLALLERHPVEVQEDDILLKVADLIVDTSLPLRENINKMLEWFGTLAYVGGKTENRLS